MNSLVKSLNFSQILMHVCIFILCALFALYLVSEAWVGAAVLASILPIFATFFLDKRLLASIWIIGIPTLFVFPNNMLDVLPFITADRLLFIILLGLLVVGRGFKSLPVTTLNSVEKAMLAYMVWLMINFIIAINGKPLQIIRSDTAFLIQAFVMPMTSYFIARRLNWTERDIERLLIAFVIVGLFLSIVGSLQYFFGITWFVPTYMEVNHPGRATGTFGNAVEYGNVMVVTLLLTMLLFVRSHDPLIKATLLFSMGIVIVGIILCLTRSPIVAFSFSVLFIWLTDQRIRPLFITGSMITILVGAIAASIFLDIDALISRFTEIDPIYNRLALWATATNIVVNNPILGIDFGRSGFIDAKSDYYTSFGSISANYAKNVGVPHMEYLHIAVLSGLVGLGLLLNIFTRIWRELTKIQRAHFEGELCGDLAIYVSAVFITYTVSGLFVDIVFNSYFPILIYFLMGLVSSLHSQKPLEYSREHSLP